MVNNGGGAKIIHHKIGHEMDEGGRGAGRRAVLELHILSFKVSILPAKMSSFNNTEVLTSGGALDWMILFVVGPLPPTST